jgi:outer membrane protein assembly factor BamB
LQEGTPDVKLARSLALLGFVSAVAGCGQRELVLPGERLDLRALETQSGGEPMDATEAAEASATDPDLVAAPLGLRVTSTTENRAEPISLGATQSNASWTHRYGSPEHRTRHPALGSQPQRIWSASIGAGNSRRGRITGDPIVAQGRVYTMDSGATITATGVNGATLWRIDLTPASDRGGEASGGGLAYADGRLFVTSGFGVLTALDAASGTVVWTQRLEAAATGTPTVVGGLVYLSARDSRAWAIRADTGRVEWEQPATPSASAMAGGAGPAVTSDLAVFPFASGELIAVERATGARVWSSAVAGTRRGRAYATISDITGDPVVDGARVYVGNQSGKAAAFDLASGQRLWTAADGAYSPVWPEGGSVFLVSDQAELVRLDAATGERIWAVELPYFQTERERRRKGVYAHYGPVVAGGRVWVPSSDGVLRGFNPVDGSLVHQAQIPGGAASNPAVAGGTLYVTSGNGQLHAFR